MRIITIYLLPLPFPLVTFTNLPSWKRNVKSKRSCKSGEQFQAQMEALHQQEAQQQYELEQMAQDLQKTSLNQGYQSEPTTPPEYRDQIFPSVFSSRNNRYSSSSLTSPPGLSSRSHRSGSQLTSPPSELAQSHIITPTPKRCHRNRFRDPGVAQMTVSLHMCLKRMVLPVVPLATQCQSLDYGVVRMSLFPSTQRPWAWVL